MYKKIKKIVISGWYGPGNIGDEAILQAMIDHFEEEFPGCQITALSFNPSYTKRTQKINAVRQVPSNIKGWIRSFISLDIFQTMKAIQTCDLFVMGGGGFLSDWQPEVPKSWLKQMKIAKFFGKETWLYGIGAGPFLTKPGKETAKYYIDHYVDKITVRDRESYRQLVENVNVSKPVEIKIDPVANLKVENFLTQRDKEHDSISLIFTEYFTNKYFNSDQHMKWDLLFEGFCAQVQAVWAKGYIPKLVFFQKNIEKKLSERFEERFGDSIRIEFPKDYKEAIGILSRSFAIISFRLHGNILAYVLKKPFLPIIYHHKTAGFLEQIEYDYPQDILEVGDGKNWKDIPIDPQEWYAKTYHFIEKVEKKQKK